MTPASSEQVRWTIAESILLKYLCTVVDPLKPFPAYIEQLIVVMFRIENKLAPNIWITLFQRRLFG